jgi:hypothetical protein
VPTCGVVCIGPEASSPRDLQAIADAATATPIADSFEESERRFKAVSILRSSPAFGPAGPALKVGDGWGAVVLVVGGVVSWA